MKQNETNLTPKYAELFHCEHCDFICRKQSDWNRHLMTRKHEMKQNETILTPKNAVKYFCSFCKFEFHSRTTLWRHKKKCIYHNESNDEKLKYEEHETDNDTTKLLDYLMNENKELKKIMIENSGTHTNNMNTTNNTNNNNFNINIFLNDYCKDAMNMSDFIESIQLSLEDVTNVGEQGQTSGFANILIDKLSSIDLYKRPLHCSDTKRETLYVKNNNEWNKETEDHIQLKNVIESISRKGIEKVPDLDLPDEKVTCALMEMVKVPVNHKKIISKVAKKMKI